MRSTFNRSALARQLAGYLPAQPDAPRLDLAERLGAWVNVRDAIALHALHQALPSAAPRRATARPGAAAAQRLALQNLRAALQRGIAAAAPQPLQADDTAFAPVHQRCNDQQRRMETGIDALRAHLRQTLAAHSAPLAQLAALDAALDQLLGGREQRLLSSVPAFLKLRFEQLRQQEPETWPERFEQELQQALLAELDLRLQPLTGLVDALAQAEAPNEPTP